MNKGEEIIDRGRSLFDVVGVALDPSTSDTILILGLVSTPERDLDDFAPIGSRTILLGFARHVKDLQDDLIEFIHQQGFSADLVGEFGYPYLKPNLKHLAVAAGLGEQGKNTLVIHPGFGPWLRFMAMKTDAPLGHTGPGIYSREEASCCSDCERCVQSCPVEVLSPYRLVDTERCLAAVTNEGFGRLAICDKCVVTCPVGERKVP